MTEVAVDTLPPADQGKRVFDKLQIQSETAKVGVNPEGGYITSWQVKKPSGDFEDILYTGNSIRRTGIPTLFPYYGEGGDKGDSHGFGRNSMWTIDAEKSTGKKVVMTLSSEQISPEAKEKYPYPFDAEITIETKEDGSLVYNLHVINKGQENLPLSPGLHPYWAVSHKDKSAITINGMEGFDAKTTDWEQNPPDNVVTYKGKTTISFPGKDISIEDITEDGSVIKYLVVWSQTPQEDDSNFVCVEPVCGKDNDINNSPILVKPNGLWDMRIRFSTTFDPAG